MSTADDVLRGLLRGLSHKEVAAELHLSPHTVNHRVQDLCRQHGVTGSKRLQAKFYADLEARHARSQAALAGFERRSGTDRRRE